MTSSPAEKLGSALSDRYRMERELGQGGMATVYLALDLRHDRHVALKVLRPELAAVIGADRFLAEIKTTAALQHPHILPLFDSGAADGFLFYVMPYVEGESLRDRLNREKQLPVVDAVRIASEVASALDYAHRHQIIHRDIKPENILLHDGRAQVADFGIALAASKAGGSRMTETGMSLGTPAYMSPEQAMGEREITARSDVYALGCVLYEMLAGEPPFTGPTAQAIVARVMMEQPRALTMQRHTIPAHVEAAVRCALEKLPADRFATAAEFGAALGNTAFGTQAAVVETGTGFGVARPAARLARLRALLPWAIAAIALGVGAWGWWRGGRTAGGVSWQYLSLGESTQVNTAFPALALSPDGSTLVFRDNVPGSRLSLKHRGELNAVSIPGTERGSNPVFSPDGEWIAFNADGQLKKVRAGGGTVATIADSVSFPGFSGAAWLDDGTIVYVAASQLSLRRVRSSGGPSSVALPDTLLRGLGAGRPKALPGARGVFFQSCSSGCVTMGIHVLDLRTGKEKPLFPDVADAWYVPTGHVLYVRRDGVALVAPFNLDRLEVSGPAVPVLEDVMVGPGFAQLAWSPAGSLIYVRNTGGSVENTIVRVDRNGVARPIDSSWSGQFVAPALAPDGHRIALGVGAATGGLDIWVKQLDHGPFTRLSFGGNDRRPAWSPDGRLIAFVRDTAATSMVVGRTADGTGSDRLLARLDRQTQEIAWSHDGKWLLLRTDNGNAGAGDIVGVRTSGDTTPVPLVHSPFTELHPAPSPDGHWLAYTSNESGKNEVYVRPFPNTEDGRWQVSTGGGTEPRWAPNGRELYFLGALGHLIAAEIRPGPGFAVGSSRSLFDVTRFNDEGFHQGYEVTPDGRYFLFSAPRREAGGTRSPQVVAAENWFTDLRARIRQ